MTFAVKDRYQMVEVKVIKTILNCYIIKAKFILMKIILFLLMVASTSLISCNEHSDTTKKNNDSAYSGLEGTREEGSQLSNATLDTNSGQTGKKPAEVKKDSTKH